MNRKKRGASCYHGETGKGRTAGANKVNCGHLKRKEPMSHLYLGIKGD